MRDQGSGWTMPMLRLTSLVLVLDVSSLVAMPTGDYSDAVTTESSQCLQIVTPSFQTIFYLEHICMELERYLKCYELDVNETAKFYQGPLSLDLYHDVHSIRIAYRGVCQDLTAITSKKHCVSEQEEAINHCNKQLEAASSHLWVSYDYDTGPSTTLYCNTYLQHADCESSAFRSCDRELGEIMLEFYTAALPTTCKMLLGVSSKYDKHASSGPEAHSMYMGIPLRENQCFPNVSEDVTAPVQDSLVAAFMQLCRYFEAFIPCVGEVLREHNLSGALLVAGVYDLFDAPSQLNAYRAFCPLLATFKDGPECTQTSNLSVSEACAKRYTEYSYEIENEDVSRLQQRDNICKTTVNVFRCELLAYTSCSEEFKNAYLNYNIAMLPNWCKTVAGVTSDFDITTTTSSSTTTPLQPSQTVSTITNTEPSSSRAKSGANRLGMSSMISLLVAIGFLFLM